jgi:integrase
MMLFPEFMGDLLLGEIDGDVLRAYRDGPLKTLPGKANHLPKEVKRPTMKATIEALRVARPDWPLMTADMRRERMLWLARFFAWLQARGYMDTDPAAGLAGESGVSKADAKAARRDALAARKAAGDDDEGRGPFSGEELKAIFLQPLFVNGHGRHIVGAERCGPHEFWLPLLGLFGGLRLKEASQLYLSDVRQVNGVWCLDLNEDTRDKSLKNEQSARLVPLHPALVVAGFLAYCDGLRREGFQRVFPELTCVASDARYSKDSGRRMSMMLEKLGMPRDGGRVFHSFRHNMNNALARVPAEVLGFADTTLAKVARYAIMGHDLPPGERDVNTASYLRGKTSEMASLVAAVRYEGLPAIARFDIVWSVEAIRDALGRKHGDRKGKEDLGEVWARRGE